MQKLTFFSKFTSVHFQKVWSLQSRQYACLFREDDGTERTVLFRLLESFSMELEWERVKQRLDLVGMDKKLPLDQEGRTLGQTDFSSAGKLKAFRKSSQEVN